MVYLRRGHPSCERGFQRGSGRSLKRLLQFVPKHASQGVGPCSVERGSDGSDSAVDGLVGGALESVRFWEFNVLASILADLLALHATVVQHARPDDLNRVLSSRVTTSHLHVHLGNGTAEGDVSVLLVHVDGIGTGQVSQHDAVVTDGAGLLLEDLASGDDFTLDLADLVLALHVVPELGAGEDGVALEDAHAVQGRVGGLLSGQGSSHNVKLSQLQQGQAEVR